ncbi:MAG: PDZ domain-containing protein [Bacteroidales bacterium]|nr:PDZ domain-containing protein [Bacteroidales bacterium]
MQKRKESVLVGAISEILSAYHYSPVVLDDAFSEKCFKLYIEHLDFNKIYLLQSDINVLETYKYKIDDEIKDKTFNFFDLSVEVIEKRIEETTLLYQEMLQSPFDYTVVEQIELNEEKINYPIDKNAQKEMWRKTLKYHTLDKIVDSYNTQLENKKKSDTVVLKSFEELEKEARAYVLKKFDNRFKRIEKLNSEDRLSVYVNTITGCFDPHTSYLPPNDKEDFDISISGKLEGIGATLSVKDEYIKVVNIVPGSASWRQGELETEDLILKVGQGDSEPVDVVGMRLDEAVQLIRGPKGSKVVLTVKKIDGSIKLIPIIRDVVMLEETFAKSTILSSKDNSKKIGYIYLPKFYVDFENAKGRRCAVDIKAELIKLNTEKVDGIIFDLRNNGGGSLADVVQIGGYFIEKGPIVQVKSKMFAPAIKEDSDPSIVYNIYLYYISNFI